MPSAQEIAPYTAPEFWIDIDDQTQETLYQNIAQVFLEIHPAQTADQNNNMEAILTALYTNDLTMKQSARKKLMTCYLFLSILNDNPDEFGKRITHILAQPGHRMFLPLLFKWDLFFVMLENNPFLYSKKPEHAEQINRFIQPIIQLVIDATRDVCEYETKSRQCYFPPAVAIRKFLSQYNFKAQVPFFEHFFKGFDFMQIEFKLLEVIWKMLSRNNALLFRLKIISSLADRSHALTFEYLLHHRSVAKALLSFKIAFSPSTQQIGSMLSDYLIYLENQDNATRQRFLLPYLDTLKYEVLSYESRAMFAKILSLQEPEIIDKFTEKCPQIKPFIDNLLLVNALVVIFNNQCPELFKAVMRIILPRLLELLLEPNVYRPIDNGVFVVDEVDLMELNNNQPIEANVVVVDEHVEKPAKRQPDGLRLLGFFSHDRTKTIVNFSSAEHFLDAEPTFLDRGPVNYKG